MDHHGRFVASVVKASFNSRVPIVDHVAALEGIFNSCQMKGLSLTWSGIFDGAYSLLKQKRNMLYSGK